MISLLTGSFKKYLLIGGATMLIAGLSYGAIKVYNYHVDTIAAAELAAENKIILKMHEVRERREQELREQLSKEKDRLEQIIVVERKINQELEKQLLIEHDLHRLLQSRPGLILNRVNKGTLEVLEKLEKITNEDYSNTDTP